MSKNSPNNTQTKYMYKYSMRYQWRMYIMTSYTKSDKNIRAKILINYKLRLKIVQVISYKEWNYFQRGCMDKWRSGDFQKRKLLKVCTRFEMKNHLTATYSYTHAENSSTSCTSILCGFCKML